MPNSYTPNANSHYWQPIYSFCLSLFASKSFDVFQVLSQNWTQYLNNEWYRPIPVPRFWLPIYGMKIHPLVFASYSPTLSSFLIQLLLLNFHHIPQAIFKIPIIYNWFGWSVMLLDVRIYAPWPLLFLWNQVVHSPLHLWHQWHYWLQCC